MLGGGGDAPFSAMRRRLWLSNSSSLPVCSTVASLRVRARATCIGLSKSSKPCTSVTAAWADSGESKTTKAWPLALRLVLATMSITLPYSEKMARNACLSGSGLTRSSRLRT